MSAPLNPAQSDAVRTRGGPLLILAGAGTGKTRVVTHRIAHLIRHGVPPQRILAVTFTNKAANEMRSRASELLPGKRRAKAKPEISTFHSLCVRILRRQIERLGYPPKFSICDSHDQESAARAGLREIKVATTTLRPGDLIFQISRWKTAAVTPDQAAQQAASDQEHLAAIAYRRYEKHLRSRGAIDFDDMLLLTERVLARHPESRHAESTRFDHLLIDEYQDTNDSQYQIAKALAERHRNLCVVGDDDQSIYGWRGARVTHILDFQRDWPDAKVVRLEENYRSAAPILVMANRLIAYNRQRHAKVLRPARHGGHRPRILQFADAEKEAKGIVGDLKGRLANRGTNARDFAILFRTNEQTRPFEMELRQAGVPYVLIGGQSFYDRREVRDTLAYLKVLANPHDEPSLLRILNTPPRGIGPTAIKRAMEVSLQQAKPLWEIVATATGADTIGPSAADAMEGFVRTMVDFRGQMEESSLAAVAGSLIDKVGYRESLSKLYPETDELQSRLVGVDEVLRALDRYEQGTDEPTLLEFVDQAVLGQQDDENDKEAKLRRDAIVLMTLHSAKGLEFAEVYLVGMEEGILPHRRSLDDGDHAIDEERRLCYVGVTRAQDRLTLSLALSRRKW
ncbi:MAG: ATP-dependent helicase, partial [Pirellulales bacterium]